MGCGPLVGLTHAAGDRTVAEHQCQRRDRNPQWKKGAPNERVRLDVADLPHPLGRRTTERDRERERRPRADLALHPDPPAVELDEPLGQGEPKAGPLP